MKKATKFELEFVKKEKVAKDTHSFYFKKPFNFNFKSGQYIKIFLDITNPDERGTSRYFTISSSPLDSGFIVITTRIIRSSFKLKLSSLRHGELVRAFGPLGYFNFDAKNKRPKIFLAGGIGITPYHSILRYIDSKQLKLGARVTLIVSFSSREEVIFFEELKEIESRNSNIRVVYTLTNDNNMYPEFEKGRINTDMIKKYTQDKDGEFFIVGPEAFEVNMIELVKDLGISETSIFTENFPGY